MDIVDETWRKLIRSIIKDCSRNGQTIGFAESCTAGLLTAAFGQQPGVSAVLRGGVIAYHGDVKLKTLNVGAATLQAHGEVSEITALEMAKGALSELECDWVVSVTGIAGPSGGTEKKPVGTVCFAVVGPNFEQTKTQHFQLGNRVEIQLESVKFAIQFLRDSIHA